MSGENSHFLARKFQDFQRQSTRTYSCGCPDEHPFQSEQRLWDHATANHAEAVEDSRDSAAWKTFLLEALNRAKQKGPSRLTPGLSPRISKASSNDNDSMKPKIGDDRQSHSPSSRPLSTTGPPRSLDNKIGDFEKLSLNQVSDIPLTNISGDGRASQPSFNPLKRAAAGESLSNQPADNTIEENGLPRTRRAKALSGGPFVSKDPEFSRRTPIISESEIPRDRSTPNRRLFDPNTDSPPYNSTNRRSAKADTTLASQRVYDPRSRLFRSQHEPFEIKDRAAQLQVRQQRPSDYETTPSSEQPDYPELVGSQSDSDTWVDPEPKILLQPETRPISHEQLVVEVKGIYAGLVMVEAKCIDVDEKQSAAAQDRNPARRTHLTPEQWQALIALHKTLLHEHHDFFLASQHPSASPALSRLAAKYSMPARMWRHGIHAFLEVLRHRLPESLDHMLAFIYIAYSMMALLYETVPTFEDTWIECLGDLGRYRMAIEDDDIRDREVWSGVARFWYGKAADNNPQVGRLYHHLAILARPFTLQQLSLYLRALTCIVPFESARGSIMTLFNPILEGKESAYHRTISVETIFIKAHGLLFTETSIEEFSNCVQQLRDGLMDSYIGRVTAKFKEQGVFAALSNIASLFDYGRIRAKDLSRSIFRLAFEEVQARKAHGEENPSPKADDVGGIEVSAAPSIPRMTVEGLTEQEVELSKRNIKYASTITFGTLSVALGRVGDKNVYPLVHTYLVFLRNLIGVEKAIKHIEMDVPWSELASFLTTLAKHQVITNRITNEAFPEPDAGAGRPLPEDFVMRGHLWTSNYFPNTWFKNAKVDDEERSLELPSFAAPRIERILWLGFRIAAGDRWIHYDSRTRTFSITQYVNDLPKNEINKLAQPLPYSTDHVMSGIDELEVSTSPDRNSPTRRHAETIERKTSTTPPTPPTPRKASSPWTSKSIFTKDDIEMPDRLNAKLNSHSPPPLVHPDSDAWLKGEYPGSKVSLQKFNPNEYASYCPKFDDMTLVYGPDGHSTNEA